MNTVQRDTQDPLYVLQERRTQLLSKNSLMIPRDLFARGDADVIRPRRQLDVLALVETLHNGRDLNEPTSSSVKVVALIDSGCTGNVMDKMFAQLHGFNAKPLPRAIPVKNADGSENRAGPVTHYTELLVTIQGHVERIPVALTDLGTAPLFLGHDWLKFHNREIDWAKGTVEFSRCPDSCGTPHDDEHEDPLADQGLEPGDRLFAFDIESYTRLKMEHQDALYMRAFQTHASKIAEQQSTEKKQQTFAERDPSAYHDFKDIFNKEDFNKLPELAPYAHAIELTKDAKPIHQKVYPMAPAEQEALD